MSRHGPEHYLKEQIKKHLATLGAYFFMPVQTGYGKRTIDVLACLSGRFLGIEAKAPGKKPNGQQEACMQDIVEAGGVAFWCDSFAAYLDHMRQNGFVR